MDQYQRMKMAISILLLLVAGIAALRYASEKMPLELRTEAMKK